MILTRGAVPYAWIIHGKRLALTSSINSLPLQHIIFRRLINNLYSLSVCFVEDIAATMEPDWRIGTKRRIVAPYRILQGVEMVYRFMQLFLIFLHPHDAEGNGRQDRDHDNHDQQLDEGKAFL